MEVDLWIGEEIVDHARGELQAVALAERYDQLLTDAIGDLFDRFVLLIQDAFDHVVHVGNDVLVDESCAASHQFTRKYTNPEGVVW